MHSYWQAVNSTTNHASGQWHSHFLHASTTTRWWMDPNKWPLLASGVWIKFLVNMNIYLVMPSHSEKRPDASLILPLRAFQGLNISAYPSDRTMNLTPSIPLHPLHSQHDSDSIIAVCTSLRSVTNFPVIQRSYSLTCWMLIVVMRLLAGQWEWGDNWRS